MHLRFARSFLALIIVLLVPAAFSAPAGASADRAAGSSAEVSSQAPGVGDPAPDWTLPGSDGTDHSLSDLRGQHVVIAFFPKAFTGG